MTGKIIGIAVCLAAIIARANAQEFGIELSGGWQGMQYSLKGGQAKLLPGGSLGLNYTFKLSDHLGLLTGVTGGVYRTQATLQDGKVFTYGAVDDVGSAFQYRLKFTGYQETQRFIAASIPLLLQYHTAGAGMQFYIDGGAKLFIPFNTNVQISAKHADITGYYPDFNVELSDLPQHGFGTLDNWETTSTLKIRPAGALSAGAGMIFRLSSGLSLYTGLFVDYGLTNLKDNKDTLPLIAYAPKGAKQTQANSVLNTQYAGRATLLSYGLQIRLSFGHSRTKSVTRLDTAARTQTAVPSQPVVQSQTVVQPTTVPRSDTAASAQTTVRPPIAAPSQPAALPKTREGSSPALSPEEAATINEPVVFGIVGETSIPQLQQPHLDELISLLKQHPNIHLTIVGHYCNGEMTTESKKVGEARAKAVMRYLQKKGIPRNRMTAVPASEGDPSLVSDPAANYQRRRVVFSWE
ncbi:MAG TPA: OmpA family protein [Puia sp.]